MRRHSLKGDERNTRRSFLKEFMCVCHEQWKSSVWEGLEQQAAERGLHSEILPGVFRQMWKVC
jgi:hypothetical protein